MRNAIAAALAFGLLVSSASVSRAASDDTPRLAPEHEGGRARVQVRVYAAVMPAANQTVALRAAAGVLAAAGIDVTWTTCDDSTAGRAPTCDVPLGRAELAVRFVRLAAAPSAGGQLQLGYALVDPMLAEGTLATVYVDRVNWLASHTGAEPSVLLGFAVAHEIGHLLLGTNAHASRGLMRALWSRRELAHAQATDWVFSPQEAAQMRSSLAERNGLRSSERDATGCAGARNGDSDASAGCGGTPTPVASLRGMAAEPRR